MRPTVWTMLMCLILTPWARAATFDCDKASTSVEKVICSDTRLTNLDDQLGRQYKDVLAALSNGGALKAEQKAWLSSRNQCKDSDCIMKAYDDRIRVLNAMSAPAKPGDVTGTYKMKDRGAAGVVLVQQKANGRVEPHTLPDGNSFGFRVTAITDSERIESRRRGKFAQSFHG